VNQTLDYAPPPEPRKRPYWAVLFAAWVASVPVVSALDDAMKSYLFGGAADGGATILAMFAILPALVVAAVLKRRWWIAAVVGGLCAPVAVVVMYLLSALTLPA
jgi:hypothetical protein